MKQQQSCPEDRFDLTAAIQRFRATILKSEFLRLCRMLRLVSSVFKSCKLSEQRKTRRAFRRPILALARFERPKEDLLDASSKDGQRRSRSALRSCTPRNWHTSDTARAPVLREWDFTWTVCLKGPRSRSGGRAVTASTCCPHLRSYTGARRRGYSDGASRAGFEVTIGSHAAMELAIERLSNGHGMTAKRGLPPGGQQSVPG